MRLLFDFESDSLKHKNPNFFSQNMAIYCDSQRMARQKLKYPRSFERGYFSFRDVLRTLLALFYFALQYFLVAYQIPP